MDAAHRPHPLRGGGRGLLASFPPDLLTLEGYERERPRTVGDQHGIGQYTDEWGCTFVNIQAGVIGEVKTPLIQDWGQDAGRVHIPPASG